MVLTSRSTTGTNSEDPPSTPSSGGWTQTGPAAAFFHFQLSGVRTPGEGTVPTAHRLAHESPFRPGPPTRRVRTPDEGTEPAAHRLAHESRFRPGPSTRRPRHFPYGPAFQEGTEPTDRPDILLLLKQRPHHGDRSWPGSLVGPTGRLPHLNLRLGLWALGNPRRSSMA